MGKLDTDFNAEAESYETRELAWELQQAQPDQQRIRMFLENQADLRQALKIADINEKELLRKPALKPLQLQRHLQQGATA
ncbi:MAG TPA: hypothetical protein VHP34_09575 [Alphaproteobacteria bacterium]|jgi:hypothetical protein|nr:hypothetical protein [Alphaproteobacteria bacterium]